MTRGGDDSSSENSETSSSRVVTVEALEGCITEATKGEAVEELTPADLKDDWTEDLPVRSRNS